METYAQMKVRHEREVKELILKFSSKHTVAETARKIGMDKDKLSRSAHYTGKTYTQENGKDKDKRKMGKSKKAVTR